MMDHEGDLTIGRDLAGHPVTYKVAGWDDAGKVLVFYRTTPGE